MKATKALLALAIMMVVIMPSCKKEDLTKSSTNPYVAIFKTAEESIGKKTEDSDKLMKEAGWSYSTEDAVWTKKVDNLEFEIEYIYTESNVIYLATFGIKSESGRTDKLSDKNYTSLLNMIGQSYTVNSKAYEFANASYGENEESLTMVNNYNDFKKAFSKFVAANSNAAVWGIEGEDYILIGGTMEGSYYGWGGEMFIADLMK